MDNPAATVDEAARSVAHERLLRHLSESIELHDARIVEAFRRVPRHRFVLEVAQQYAYDDRALPLIEDQTISQPTMIAIMLEALGCEPHHRVLEIGAGSGYAAALLAQLVSEVYAIEIRPALASRATRTLRELGLHNVEVLTGNGRRGLPERAPFDRILVSAGSPDVPTALLEQLAPGGRIAIPVGQELGQKLLIGKREGPGAIHWETSIACTFVPLVFGNPHPNAS